MERYQAVDVRFTNLSNPVSLLKTKLTCISWFWPRTTQIRVQTRSKHIEHTSFNPEFVKELKSPKFSSRTVEPEFKIGVFSSFFTLTSIDEIRAVIILLRRPVSLRDRCRDLKLAEEEMSFKP